MALFNSKKSFLLPILAVSTSAFGLSGCQKELSTATLSSQSRASAEALTEQLIVTESDDFTHNKSKTSYYLKNEAKGEYQELSPEEGSRRSQFAKASSTPVTGRQRILVVPVNFSGKSLLEDTSLSRRQLLKWLEHSYFGAPTQADPTPTVRSYFAEVSKNRILISGRVHQRHVTVKAELDSQCLTFDWAKEADQELAKQGIDLKAYNYISYIVPSIAACEWHGLAIIGGAKSWVKITSAYISAHEIGHNFGLHHANKGTNFIDSVNYGDYSDVMGTTFSHLNAVHMDELGLLDSSSIENIEERKVVTVRPLGQGQPGSVEVLKLPNDVVSDYYFSYRQKWGSDERSLLDEFTEGLNIHLRLAQYLPSIYVRTLKDGEYFEDPHTGLRLRQISHDSQGVQIEILDSPGDRLVRASVEFEVEDIPAGSPAYCTDTKFTRPVARKVTVRGHLFHADTLAPIVNQPVTLCVKRPDERYFLSGGCIGIVSNDRGELVESLALQRSWSYPVCFSAAEMMAAIWLGNPETATTPPLQLLPNFSTGL